MYKHCAVLFGLLFTITLHAQQSVKFDSYSIEDGLSQSHITGIVQDRFGYIWISTQDGLNRFNGYEFNIYKNQLNDSVSLPNNYLHSLYEDKAGQLWFGTNRGIGKIDPLTGKIQSINRKDYPKLRGYIFTTLAIDKDENIWALSEKHGINCINTDSKDVRNIGSLGNSTNFSTLFIDPLDRLWIGNTYGDIFFSTYPYKSFKKLDQSLTNSKINRFYFYNNNIVVCTEAGVFNIDQNFETAYFADFPEIKYQNITSIFFENDKKIWFGTKDYGLYLLNDMNTKKAVLYQYSTNPYNPYSLCDDHINTIFNDNSGNVWIGTEKGIAKFDTYKQGFTVVGINNNSEQGLVDQNVWSFSEDSTESIYIGTKKDLTIYHPLKNKFSHFYRAEKNEHYLMSIYPETPQKIWLGYDDGLFILTINTPYDYHFTKVEFLENSIDQSIRVYQIKPYKNNQLWIGSRAGLSLLNKNDLSYTFYHPSNLSNSIGDGAVKVIYQDLKNNFWFVTTNDGLFKMIEENDKNIFIPYVTTSEGSNNAHITSLLQTDTNSLWIGTYGEGLKYLNLAKGKLTSYSEANGLANNVIYGLLADEAKNIWMSTNKGLSNFIVDTKTFENYSTNDGLPSNEFNTNAYFKSSDKSLYFGGIKGYTKFKRKSITINPIKPTVVISDITVHNKRKSSDQKELISHSYSDTLVLELPYYQNDITIEFFSAHYSNPEKNSFKYMLEGYDNEYTYITDDNKVNYMNLPDNNYTFIVYSKNPDGIWSERPARLKIKITPPFWLTWWFIVLCIIAFIFAIFYIYQIRVAQIRHQKVKLELEVVKRTRKISEQNAQIIEQNAQVEIQKAKIEQQKELIQQEKEKVEGILLNILPEGTAAELISKGKSKARYYKRVTVMFTDFVGFSKIAENMKPQDLVRQLDSYFTNFDKIISKFDLEKIKTIGDAYMCAGGVPIRNKSNAIEVVLAALAIQEFMLDYNAKLEEKGKESWNIRIGINTGEVTAGVIGQKRFAYDIWGSTVNQAQRMEMHGEPNTVNVSGNTYEIIAPYFLCNYRGKIQTKHNGTLDMYFVEGIKPELSINGEGKKPNKKFWQIVDLHIYSSINYMKAERHIMRVLEEQLSPKLYYHSINHTKDVTEAAERIALMEGITDEDLFLLKSAASYHDAGFVEKYNQNEEIGMRMARETLPKYGYTQAQIDVIDGLIKATEIPQSPKTLLEQIMCDADLDYLGRDDFHEIADLLRKELREHGIINSDRLWDEIQVKFLTQHTYFTKSAISTRQKKKMKHLEEIKEKLKTFNYKD
jgi:ligand-binding sensor domain-containing protein/class 3 adenylate cyclase/predicted metal-dependent HD superfamily phosphohydrolase